MQFNTVDEILDYAIEREEQAAKLYADLAGTVERPGMREAFLEFAAEEGRHKARLMRIKAGDLPAAGHFQAVPDLKISDELVSAKPTPNMTYAEALMIAMKAEKAAFRLYEQLAQATTDQGLADVFRGLAQEEAKHKLRFEIEYDDHVLEGV
jgi:rubrerythrin